MDRKQREDHYICRLSCLSAGDYTTALKPIISYKILVNIGHILP